MRQWPHAPLYIFDEAGTYMVTSATYKKQRIFDTSDKLQLLHDTLLNLVPAYGWALQAWAVMSNHYHFVAVSPDGDVNLRQLISQLHKKTARQINQVDDTQKRRVWFQFWDSHITFEKSYLARLNYVHNNPVHHGIVNAAVKYPWCSAAWFERTADSSFYNTVSNIKTDRISVIDNF
jgi:putative transposase